MCYNIPWIINDKLNTVFGSCLTTYWYFHLKVPHRRFGMNCRASLPENKLNHLRFNFRRFLHTYCNSRNAFPFLQMHWLSIYIPFTPVCSLRGSANSRLKAEKVRTKWNFCSLPSAPLLRIFFLFSEKHSLPTRWLYRSPYKLVPFKIKYPEESDT